MINRAQHGSVYKLLLAGRYIVVVSSPELLIDVVTRSTKIFGSINDLQLRRLTDIKPERLPLVVDILHRQIYAIVTGGLAKGAMASVTNSMSRHLFASLRSVLAEEDQHVDLPLRHFVGEQIYNASTAAFFGSGKIPDNYADFALLDEGMFYLLNGIPFLNRTSDSARRRIQQGMSMYAHAAYNDEASCFTEPSTAVIAQCVAELRTSGITQNEAESLLTMVHWGFQANMIGTAIAAVAFLLSDTHTNDSLTRQVRALVTTRWPDIDSLLSAPPYEFDDPEFALLDSVIQETLRLVSLPTAVREVLSDTFIYPEGGEPLLVQKGELILGDIYGMHHDEDLFSQPHKFQSDRYVALKERREGKGSIKAPMAWGGGPFVVSLRRLLLVT